MRHSLARYGCIVFNRGSRSDPGWWDPTSIDSFVAEGVCTSVPFDGNGGDGVCQWGLLVGDVKAAILSELL